MPDDWRLPGFCTVRTIPVEDIQNLLDHAIRDGIENEHLAYNRSFKYMPLDLYFVEYVSMRERRKTNREKGGGGPDGIRFRPFFDGTSNELYKKCAG